MTRDVLLEIVGRQTIDGYNDKIEMTVVGEMEETDKEYIITYVEAQDPPHAPINTQMKINKDKQCVVLSRHGGLNTCLVIEPSKRNMCQYNTEFGSFMLGIYGRSVFYDMNDKDGKFRFNYDIEVNGSLASQNESDITLKFRS